MWFNKNLLLCHQSIHFQSFQTDFVLQYGTLWLVVTYCHFRIVAMIVVDAFDKSAAPNYKQKNSNCNFLTNPGMNLQFWVNKPAPYIFIRFHFYNIPITFTLHFNKISHYISITFPLHVRNISHYISLTFHITFPWHFTLHFLYI